MADYIYLLENRLSKAQHNAILAVREIARAKGLTVFLVGGAVRDLTSGAPVRDLDVVVQGNALKLKKDVEKAGGVVTGEHEAGQALFVRFPGSVRMEIGSTLTVTYPKPGKAAVKPATILEDLRRRDFTANAMALSLNAGSYGLLMDPLNGVADIENRELRLVSNYGFIEDPVRMIRAARYAARLGWQLEAKTQTRYETGKAESYIDALTDFPRGYEAEQLVHEEDPLRVMRRLESEGWMKYLSPAWTSAKANVVELEKLRDAQMQLQMQGVTSDPAAAQFPLLTAKLTTKETDELKRSFPRQGFVAEIDALEGEAKKFAAELGSKQAATPSAAWKLIAGARPEVVLWVAYSTKSAALQAKFASFYTEWPQARTKVPIALMQEMRILPELPGYGDLVEKLVFELMDGKLGTVEEMKAFLEPFSPPAPPPPVHLRRARATKKETKAKSRKKVAAVVAEDGDGVPDELVEAAGPGADNEAIVAPRNDVAAKVGHPASVKPAPIAAKAVAKKVVPVAKPSPAKAVAPPVKKAVAPVKKAAPVKAVPAKKAVAKKLPAKKSVKVAVKKSVKVVAKAAAKKVPAKKAIAVKGKVAVKAPLKASAKARKPVKVVAKAASRGGSKQAAKGAAKKVVKKVAAKKKR